MRHPSIARPLFLLGMILMAICPQSSGQESVAVDSEPPTPGSLDALLADPDEMAQQYLLLRLTNDSGGLDPQIFAEAQDLRGAATDNDPPSELTNICIKQASMADGAEYVQYQKIAIVRDPLTGKVVACLPPASGQPDAPMWSSQ